MEKIDEFLKVNSGSGDGSGDGSGYGDGYGSGSGDGSGYGSGDGSGSGDGVQLINGDKIHSIDDVPTIIKQLKKNVARGFILNNDLTLTPCVVVKSNNMFAHGENLHKAMESLQEKLFDGMTTEERIEAFLKEFNLVDKYSAQKFFEWHNKLTGSCEMGRVSFAKNNGIDLENDTYTVKEFIEKTRNDYGRDVIRQLEKTIKGE